MNKLLHLYVSCCLSSYYGTVTCPFHALREVCGDHGQVIQQGLPHCIFARFLLSREKIATEK